MKAPKSVYVEPTDLCACTHQAGRHFRCAGVCSDCDCLTYICAANCSHGAGGQKRIKGCACQKLDEDADAVLIGDFVEEGSAPPTPEQVAVGLRVLDRVIQSFAGVEVIPLRLPPHDQPVTRKSSEQAELAHKSECHKSCRIVRYDRREEKKKVNDGQTHFIGDDCIGSHLPDWALRDAEELVVLARSKKKPLTAVELRDKIGYELYAAHVTSKEVK